MLMIGYAAEKNWIDWPKKSVGYEGDRKYYAITENGENPVFTKINTNN